MYRHILSMISIIYHLIPMFPESIEFLVGYLSETRNRIQGVVDENSVISTGNQTNEMECMRKDFLLLIIPLLFSLPLHPYMRLEVSSCA